MEQEGATTHVIQTRVDAEYFGFRDEEDGMLLAYEKEQENQGRFPLKSF